MLQNPADGCDDEFGLAKVDPGIMNHLEYAYKVPFTDTEEQVLALQHALLG